MALPPSRYKLEPMTKARLVLAAESGDNASMIEVEWMARELLRDRAAAKRMLSTHDGFHTSDCNAFGSGLLDEDLATEAFTADPHCDCGAADERNAVRASLLPGEESKT